jgi:membrane fusion protein (multidrug efflux system)
MTPPADPKLHEVPREREGGAAPEPTPTPLPARPNGRKRRVLVGVGLVVAAAAGVFGTHLYLTRGDVSTDDAQIEADVVAIAPRVPGTIAEVLVADNAAVKEGQPILRLDDADYQVRVRQAEAELETARAQAATAEAQVGAARASVTKAEAEAEKAALDLRRAEALKAGDAIASERFDATRIGSETAQAGAGQNRAQYAAALAGANLARARVKVAEAALEAARLQLSYTLVKAPAAGSISRLSARNGQIVQAAQALGQLVPSRTYVVANFKETQTGAIRPGQPVDVEIDAYGGKALHGKVESISGGTGARFALLPPDNASGNFVKVVERVPVRVTWDDAPSDLPLRAGLSAYVTVHTR